MVIEKTQSANHLMAPVNERKYKFQIYIGRLRILHKWFLFGNLLEMYMCMSPITQKQIL
jgi:hypothetical protein